MSRFILSGFGDEIASDLTTQMDVMEKHEIKYIELRKVNGKGVEKHTLDELKAIKRELDVRGFKISAIGSPIGKIRITDEFQPHLDLFKHVLEAARILEAKYIRMFSFYIPEGELPGFYRDEVIRRWRLFIETAAGSGLVLLHENEKNIYGDTPERCLDLLRTINSDMLKAVFDPANFIQCDVKTYPEAFQMLREYIVYMHIKDALYRNHQVVPAGQGNGRIKEILTALHQSGYRGFLSLEPHLASFEGFDGLEVHSRNSLPKGDNPEKFGIAAMALKKLLTEITG